MSTLDYNSKTIEFAEENEIRNLKKGKAFTSFDPYHQVDKFGEVDYEKQADNSYIGTNDNQRILESHENLRDFNNGMYFASSKNESILGKDLRTLHS